MTYPFAMGWQRGYTLPTTAPDPSPPSSYSRQMAMAWVAGLAEGKSARDRLVEFRVARARDSHVKAERYSAQAARDRLLKRAFYAKQQAKAT